MGEELGGAGGEMRWPTQLVCWLKSAARSSESNLKALSLDPFVRSFLLRFAPFQVNLKH